VGYVEAMGCMNMGLCMVVSIGLVLISLPPTFCARPIGPTDKEQNHIFHLC